MLRAIRISAVGVLAAALLSIAPSPSSTATTQASTAVAPASAASLEWATTFAKAFEKRINHRRWPWIRRHIRPSQRAALISDLRWYRKRGRFDRVPGTCGDMGDVIWCDFEHRVGYVAIELKRRPSGAARLVGLQLQD